LLVDSCTFLPEFQGSMTLERDLAGAVCFLICVKIKRSTIWYIIFDYC